MTLAMLIVGIVAVVAGLLAILFGFTVREFSLGSTLIISGTIGVCSGMLLAGLHLVLLELKGIARRLADAPSEVRVRPVLPGLAVQGAPSSEPISAPAMRAEPTPPPSPAVVPPWLGEAPARERPRAESPPEPVAATPPEPPRRRNLMFASTSRKERERAEAKAAEGAPPSEEPVAPAAPETPPASFDDAWPKPDRMRPPEPPAVARRPSPPPRSPSTFTEAPPPPLAAEPEPAAEQPPVTVLKSGIVDGMAYSLYSDGSIEAQMPEGMMRFASIDELRAHLDQRS
ncbi:MULTISPECIES: DUF308 domain-containing protein [Bradyrhizobium]|uniref:DUF308 domain-containing protein n=1 Tax=Bradyrhizobium TaxID=374 RepID=UPI001BAC7F33|nr:MULTISPECIES: DUF308 domain-containing protein [Bradyrhizobium]MBR0710254.1 DUF308 domain-containing protein [Bradyrhizobium liaoningense]MDA9403116.1 hypothetical protein [Bradyrhizobium sp. CCBAU 45389]